MVVFTVTVTVPATEVVVDGIVMVDVPFIVTVCAGVFTTAVPEESTVTESVEIVNTPVTEVFFG